MQIWHPKAPVFSSLKGEHLWYTWNIATWYALPMVKPSHMGITHVMNLVWHMIIGVGSIIWQYF